MPPPGHKNNEDNYKTDMFHGNGSFGEGFLKIYVLQVFLQLITAELGWPGTILVHRRISQKIAESKGIMWRCGAVRRELWSQRISAVCGIVGLFGCRQLTTAFNGRRSWRAFLITKTLSYSIDLAPFVPKCFEDPGEMFPPADFDGNDYLCSADGHVAVPDEGTKKAGRDLDPCRLSLLTINYGVALDPHLNHTVDPRDIR